MEFVLQRKWLLSHSIPFLLSLWMKILLLELGLSDDHFVHVSLCELATMSDVGVQAFHLGEVPVCLCHVSKPYLMSVLEIDFN